MDTLYLDISFFVNFSINTVLLWATAKIMQKKAKLSRIFFASFLGTIYALLFIVINWAWLYSIPGKIIISILMIYIAFGKRNLKDFFKLISCFYILSFLLAGIQLAIVLQTDKNNYLEFSYFAFFLASLIIFIIGSKGYQYIKGFLIPIILKYKVRFYFNNNFCEADAYLDTGNSLRDPISNKPVIIAEYETFIKCLPEECIKLLKQDLPEQEILDSLLSSQIANRLRIIPFRSVGKNNGILLGIRSDEVHLYTGKEKVIHQGLIIGLYRGKLSNEDKYQVLLPVDIL